MFTAAPTSPRPSGWEWVQVTLLAITLTWTTLGLGGYLAATMSVTTALVALSLAVHGAWRAVGASAHGWHPAGWCVVPFLAYAAANVAWVTPVPWLGWQDWLGWAQAGAIFWVVVNDVRSRPGRLVLWTVLLAVATVAVGLACYQRFADPAWLPWGHTQAAQFLGRSSGSFFVPNSLAALLVLLIPSVLFPVFRRGSGAVARFGLGYLAALLLLGLGLTISRGAWLGLAIALVAWPWVAGRRRKGHRLLTTLAVALALGSVAATAYFSVPKIRERLDYFVLQSGEKSRPELWRAAWQIFRAYPLWGGGAGSYNTRFELHRPEHEQKEPQWAHSDYLNTLADYGLVGFSLCCGAAGIVVGRSVRRPGRATAAGAWDWFDTRGFSAALGVGLLAFGLHLAVDFHLKIPALAMSAACLAALAVGRDWPGPESTSGGARRVLGAVLIVLALGGAAGWTIPAYRAEAIRDGARRRLDALARGPALLPRDRAAVVRASHEALSRAIALDPANAQAWADRAYTAAILGRDDPTQEKVLGLAGESDARRALALARGVPEFWLRLGVALDMQRRWWEAGEATAEALRLAPVSAQTWFYYAYHLSLNPITVPRARAAVATSLRLDQSAPEAEALRQSLAARHLR